MSAVTTRMEHDLLGDREVPDAAYYGVHTLRALENFDITGEIALERKLINPEQRAEVLRPEVLPRPPMIPTQAA